MKILIVGQGIAGSLLAWRLLEQNHTVQILSAPNQVSASRVAAGVLTPITGKRFAVSWEYHRLYNEAVTTYKKLGQQFNQKIFYPRKTIRIFRSAREKNLWDKKSQARPDFLPFVENNFSAEDLPPPWDAPFGGMTLIHGGWCDTECLLQNLSDFFEAKKILHYQQCEHKSLSLTDKAVSWNNEEFDYVIFCEGYQIRENPFFNNIPFEHVKGETLTLSFNASIPDNAILNFGKWVIPYPDNTFRCGSTYDWYNLNETPTAEAKKNILDALNAHFKINPQVKDQQAGVRPVCKDMKPVLGPHPQYPRLWVFNGLGAKGILRSPWLSKHLVEVLNKKVDLWCEVDCRRFWPNITNAEKSTKTLA